MSVRDIITYIVRNNPQAVATKMATAGALSTAQLPYGFVTPTLTPENFLSQVADFYKLVTKDSKEQAKIVAAFLDVQPLANGEHLQELLNLIAKYGSLGTAVEVSLLQEAAQPNISNRAEGSQTMDVKLDTTTLLVSLTVLTLLLVGTLVTLRYVVKKFSNFFN